MAAAEAPSEPRPDGIARAQRLMRRAYGFAVRHLTVLVAATTSLLVILKIMAVADFDFDVALGLLTSSDTSRVAIAIAITLLPIVVVLLTVIVWAGAAFMEDAAPRIVAIVVGTFLFLLSLRVTPLNQGVLLFGLIAYTLIFAWVAVTDMYQRFNAPAPSQAEGVVPSKPSEVSDDSDELGPGSWSAYGLFLGFCFLIMIGRILGPGLAKPWMPRERLTLGASTATAYVVSIEDGWLTYLSDPNRDLVVVAADTLLERAVCPVMGNERSLPQYLVEDVRLDINAIDVGRIPTDALALVTYVADSLTGVIYTPTC